MASDTGAPLTIPHCKQRSRLFEAIEPPTIKRPRKGKTSMRKFVFFGKFAKPRGSHSGEIGSSLNSACRPRRWALHHEPGRCGLGSFCGRDSPSEGVRKEAIRDVQQWKTVTLRTDCLLTLIRYRFRLEERR